VWLFVALLWMCAAYFLVRMPKAAMRGGVGETVAV
jgi:hypothetical protein